eukprot:6376090-Prymnesium_polylepis.4
MSGVIALAAALKYSSITDLKYVCPSSTSPALLAGNDICKDGKMEGLYALIEAVKQMPQLSSLT